MGRAPCCDKSNVKRGPWSPEEDAKLKEYMEKYGNGGNWIALPQKLGLKRCGKSCRLRWLNYLRPDIKHGDFTEEEDLTICRMFSAVGSRWSLIVQYLPGRTDNDIKNYWNTKLKKKLISFFQQQLVMQNQKNQSPFPFPSNQTKYLTPQLHPSSDRNDPSLLVHNIPTTTTSLINPFETNLSLSQNQEKIMIHPVISYNMNMKSNMLSFQSNEGLSYSSNSDGNCYSQQIDFSTVTDEDNHHNQIGLPHQRVYKDHIPIEYKENFELSDYNDDNHINGVRESSMNQSLWASGYHNLALDDVNLLINNSRGNNNCNNNYEEENNSRFGPFLIIDENKISSAATTTTNATPQYYY